MRADRSIPILKTSSKTNLGHLEAGAGMAGLIKCICMLNYSAGAPNIHLLVLNPHLDVAGELKKKGFKMSFHIYIRDLIYYAICFHDIYIYIWMYDI